MKKLFVLFLFPAFIFISCKKTRVCNCTTITSGETTTHTSSLILQIDTTVVTPLSTSSSNKVKFYKVTKKRAKNNCFNKTETINETTNNGVPGILDLNVTNTGTRDYTCKLE